MLIFVLKCRKRKGVCSFFRRVWRAMKPPFHSKNKMEPFVPPPELDDPELSPDPESSDFIPTNGKSVIIITDTFN